MKHLEKMRQYSEKSCIGCYDIAAKLIHLTGCEAATELEEDLLDALYQLKAIAQNPYNPYTYRVLYNILSDIAEKD